jgi:hypothetical protein
MSQRSFVTVTVTLALLVASFNAHAQDLKPWETAIKYMEEKKGCLSIPYSDAQETCQRKQAEVERWCKDPEGFSCKKVDPKQFQREIEKVKTERDGLNNERTRLTDARSREKDEKVKQELSTKIAKIESDLSALANTQTALERKVQDGARDCSENLTIAKTCRDYRMSVQDVFYDVMRRADNEVDEKIIPLADRLINEWWTPEDKGHEIQVSGVKRAVEICEQALYEIGRLGTF